MSRPAARIFPTLPILAFAILLAAGALGAAWASCQSAAATEAPATGSPWFLGITYLEMNAQTAAHHPGCVTGALVTAVKPGGAADQAGLRAGDTVIGVGDRPLGNDWTLLQGLLDLPGGSPVTVSVRRGDLTLSLPITLTARP